MFRLAETLRFSPLLLTIGLAGLVPTDAMSADYTAIVSTIQPNHDTADCIFFRLSGVSDVWPASPGDWFAIPRSSLGSMETFAILLTSRVKSIQITVKTDGTMACGYAQATYVLM